MCVSVNMGGGTTQDSGHVRWQSTLLRRIAVALSAVGFIKQQEFAVVIELWVPPL
jgi:hypothetical protein